MMASTTSVSKGCFVFNKDKFVKRRTGKTLVKQEFLYDDPWYLAYKQSWNWVEEKFEALCHDTFSNVLNGLVTFVDDSYKKEKVEHDISAVPTAALLTGINMPDHGALFSTLCKSLHENVSCHVATLHANKCKTIRHAVEQMTSQFMNIPSDEDSDSEERYVKVKRSQCNMFVLQSWYHMKFSPFSEKTNLKRKERDSEDNDTDGLQADIKRQKLDIQIVEDEIIKTSPRNFIKDISCRKTSDNGEENDEVFHRTLKKQAIDRKVNSFNSNLSECPLELNDDVSTLQKTPTKQCKIDDMDKKDVPKLQRTPGKSSEGKIDSNVPNVCSTETKSYETIQQGSGTSKMTPNKMRMQRNGGKWCDIDNIKMILPSNSTTKKNNVDSSENTPTKNQEVTRVDIFRNIEIRSSQPLVDYDITSEGSDSSIDSLTKKRRGEKPNRKLNKCKQTAIKRNAQIKEESKKQLLNSPVRRSQRTPKPIIKDIFSGENTDSSLNSPDEEDSDKSVREESVSVVYEDSDSDSSVHLLNKNRGEKKMEINFNETLNSTLRRSKRPSKPIIKDNILYSEESDVSINLCDRKTKLKTRKKDSTCVTQTASEEMTSDENHNKENPSRSIKGVVDEVNKNNGCLENKNWICHQNIENAGKIVPLLVLEKIEFLQKFPKKKNVKPELDSHCKKMCLDEKTQKTPVKNSHNFMVMESKENLHCATIGSPLHTSKPLFQNSGNEFHHRKKLIVIIPEFEKFSSKVLQDLIMILRSNIPSLPIVLIMGIATSVAVVHQSLPYRMSACLSIKAFQSPPSVQLLNSVLEKILFSSEFPFRLGGKTFRFLMDVFLFYDLSIRGFVQAMKFCMMEHFCGQNWKVLCCKPETLNEGKKFTAEDFTALRNLPTFIMYINQLEKLEEKKKLMNENEYTQKIIVKLLKDLHNTFQAFHVALKCLHILVADLPKKPLGTHLRELYGIAVSSRITRTSEYEECIQLLKFLSRDELLMKIDKIVTCLQENNKLPILNTFYGDICNYRKKIQEAGVTLISPKSSPTKNILQGKMNRYDFKAKLKLLSKNNLNQSPFEKIREEFFNYLSREITLMLHPPAAKPLAEVFMFDNWASVKTHVVGAPRAALHTALNDPQFYLECECCKQDEKDNILSAMPDICIAYKLYRECGRLINLYDWLQSFSAVVDPHEDDEEREINPQVQARFTRAVAELQFMGFLKTSSRKIDHVTKLCYDGGF